MHNYIGNKTTRGQKTIGKIKMMKKTNINQEKQSEKEDKEQLEEDLLEEMGRNIKTCLEFRLCGNAMFKMLRGLGF
jgi:DNA replication protein DnaD